MAKAKAKVRRDPLTAELHRLEDQLAAPAPDDEHQLQVALDHCALQSRYWRVRQVIESRKVDKAKTVVEARLARSESKASSTLALEWERRRAQAAGGLVLIRLEELKRLMQEQQRAASQLKEIETT